MVWPDNRTSALRASEGPLGGEPTFIFGERVSLAPPAYPPSNSQTEPAIAYSYYAESSLVAWQDYGHLVPAPPYLGIWGPSEVVFLPLVLCKW